MPLKIRYQCDKCGNEMPQDWRSMMCSCGGTFRTEFARYAGYCSQFEPHFCPTLKTWVSSWKDQERKAAAFRSEDHPEGFTLLQANKKYVNHLKNVRKNAEDIKAQQYAKDGIKYPKGKPVKFDEHKQTFVNKHTHEPITTKRYSTPHVPLRTSSKLVKKAALVVGFLLCASCSFAKIDGVPYITLTVNGSNYEVPIHQPDFTEEKAKIVLDMLDGDKNARKIFLQGKDQRVFFIGDGEKVRWLYVTKDKEWVKEL